MTSPAIEFTSAHSLIAQMLEDTSLNDPREIAEAVASMIPPDLQYQILVNALIGDVRVVMASRRNVALSNAFKPSVEPVAGGSIQGSPKRPGRSAKVSGIRDWWSEMLRERVYVGESRWMTLGDCGVEELLYAERSRRDRAEQEIRRAKMYLRLRELLDQHEVDTVAELPGSAARAALA